MSRAGSSIVSEHKLDTTLNSASKSPDFLKAPWHLVENVVPGPTYFEYCLVFGQRTAFFDLAQVQFSIVAGNSRNSTFCKITLLHLAHDTEMGVRRRWIETLGTSPPCLQSALAWGAVDDGVGFGSCLCAHEQTGVNMQHLFLRIQHAPGFGNDCWCVRFPGLCKFRESLEPLVFGFCRQLVTTAPLLEAGCVGEAFRHHVLVNTCI